jgi:hypothetical protein
MKSGLLHIKEKEFHDTTEQMKELTIVQHFYCQQKDGVTSSN